MPQNRKTPASKQSPSLNQQKETEERAHKARLKQIPGGLSAKRGSGYGVNLHFTKL